MPETGREEEAVLRLDKDLIASNVPQIKETIRAELEAGRNMVLDLQEVETMDSKGIGLLIATHNSLREKGAALEIVNPTENILKLLQNMRLDKHFRIS